MVYINKRSSCLRINRPLGTDPYIKRYTNSSLKEGREISPYGSPLVYSSRVDVDISTIYKIERGEINITLSRFYTLLRGQGKSHEQILEMFNTDTHDKEKAIISISDKDITYVITQMSNEIDKQILKNLRNEDIQRLITILIIGTNKTKKNDFVKQVGLGSKSKNFNLVFGIALKNNWIAMLYPESPRRHDQKYYTTEAGKAVLRLGLESIKDFRNRINHCEPICFKDAHIDCSEAENIHKTLYDLISWLDPDIVPFFMAVDNVPNKIDFIKKNIEDLI